MADKKADLAGPGIGDYQQLEKILPEDYRSLLSPKETQKAIFEVKRYIEDNLCKELNLMMVEVPLIVDEESGVNDLPRSRRLAHPHPVPHHQRSRQAPHQRPGGAGRHQVEDVMALKQFRHAAWRGSVYPYARRAQGLLPRPRSQRLCRSVGLGARDHLLSSATLIS